MDGQRQVLFLTNNRNVCSTARILQRWLVLGRQADLRGHTVVKQRGDFTDWLVTEQLSHLIDPMPWPDRRRPWNSFWHAWRVARWARRNGVDIIHCNEHDVYPFARLLRRVLRVPLVCHVRFLVTREFAEWTFSGASRRPDALFWTSFQQRQDCAAAVHNLVPEDRQHVVRLGIDLDAFGKLAHLRESVRAGWHVSPDEVVIGTASPLRPRKRVEDFVELIARIAQRQPKVVGVLAGGPIAGDEAYHQTIVHKIQQTGLGRRLQWLGNLEPIEPFYHGCDIVVSTSEYETFGNSVCEAMACRRPVVGYQGGSVQEVVGDAGITVQTGDLDGLTAAVERLIEAPDLRRQLGEAARQRVAELFNPAVSLRQLQQIYHSLLDGRVEACAHA
jgi:glycosyltransferase involved in cell wall biosynthesis